MRCLASPFITVAALTFAACAQNPHVHRSGDAMTSSPAATRIVLDDAAAELAAQPMPDQQRHKVLPLSEYGPVSHVLMQFEQGAYVPDHAVEGVAVAHVLEGHLQITVEGTVHDLEAGEVLVMAPGAVHDVRALQPSRMLRTIALSNP